MKPNEDILEAMRKDLKYWRGPLYFNRDDPKFLVPKYNKAMGMTFNFAKPYAYIIIFGALAIALIVRYIF